MATKPPIFLETMDFEKHCEVLFYKEVAPMPILQYPKESPKVPNEKKQLWANIKMDTYGQAF